MKTFNYEKLSANIENLKKRIQIIAQESGRNYTDVRIVPATKYVDINVCEAMIELGFKELGENRIQELERKAKVLSDFTGWHFFGHLQKNKVRKALKHCKIIETVDSAALAERIAFIAQDEGIEKVELFIEVKTSEEDSKTGADVSEVGAIIEVIQKNPVLELCGLMTMAAQASLILPTASTTGLKVKCPIDSVEKKSRKLALGNPEYSRKYFRELREYRDKLQNNFSIEIPELSMGMSQDFEYAIQEGATILRLGSVIYEGIFETV
ncbi:MAG: YggS family pyridoxal phosphate enzyme [Planctomycetes bacterium]|nr:YggS family pyridoxal phosphate enzyme [Planctomycetota bacterium]